jgi:uncharacterized protein (DUF1800 family)
MDRPQLCSALIRTPRFVPDNGLDNGLEELALYLLSLLYRHFVLDTMKLIYIGWMLGMALGWPRLVAQTPDIVSLTWTNGRPSLEFRLVPSVSDYRVRGSGTLAAPGSTVAGKHSGTFWTAESAADGDSRFYRLEAVPLAAETVRASTLLNRIAYGPTPDDLDRLATLGTDAYIEEQLAPEKILENLDEPTATGPVWRKITVTGTGSSSKLYVYLSGAGDAYLDDFRLVAGASDTGTAPNLLINGDFEQPLAAANWTTTTNTANSARTTDFVHGGNASFHLVQAAAGRTGTDAVVQTITTALNASTTYTLSFWYLAQSSSLQLTVRLSGSGITVTAPLRGDAESPAPYYARLQNGTATIADLRAWHVLHAVQSRRQLAQIFQQFLENHFVTEYSKGLTYFDERAGLPNAWSGPESTRQEFQENLRWRQAFQNPRCTFHDLLKISAESPAMIIYLDTVLSRGDYSTTTKTNRIANENYARELCELFAFGVDNGYDQGDIEQISRAWTGWTVELLSTNQAANPFAPRTTVMINSGLTNATERNSVTNLAGLWSFRYRTDRHDPRVKWIFYERDTQGNILTNSPKTVPARFGPPWAGRTYGLKLSNGSTTNGIQDGYQILRHMADQPFTQEYLSVKLCRLLVHDNFHHGYDFTDSDTSPEESLVHECMLAWENPPNGGPKGQMREVLRVILKSELFRNPNTAAAKVKTPLEFAASTLRAFRAVKPDGTTTAMADAANLVASGGLLDRAGRMRLFDRADPDGYAEDAGSWISAGTLGERLRYVQSLALAGAGLASGTGVRSSPDSSGSSRIDPSALLTLRLTNGANRSAEAVTDELLRLLFPSEGAGNLSQYQALAIQFLNTADNGTTASDFSRLVPGTKEYDGRVRGLVALLLSTPRFQEQ